MGLRDAAVHPGSRPRSRHAVPHRKVRSIVQRRKERIKASS